MTVPDTIRRLRGMPIFAAIALALWALAAQGWDDPATPLPVSPSPPPVVAPAAPKPPAPATFSWDLSPYRVQAWIVAGRGASFPEGESPTWRKLVAEKVESSLGPGCQVRIGDFPPQVKTMLRGSLDSLDVTSIAPELTKPTPDKLFLVGAMAGEDGATLEIRELDLRTWNLGPTSKRPFPHRTLIADEIARGVGESFRAIARVERAEGHTVSILPRAGGLLIAGRSRGEIRSGEILRVFMRRADRFGEAKPQDVGPIPWSYVIASESSGRFVKSQVVSALRDPLSGRHSSRVEKLALLIRPQESATTLLLKARQPPHAPLAGYEIVDLQPEKEPRSLGVTDGAGRLVIPPRAEGVYRLHVRHGREVLARLPLVAGVEREVTGFLSDDGPRLDAEGFLTGVQETLIDTVARRQVAFARIDRLLNRRDIPGAAREMELLRLLPTRAQLAQQLTNQQARFTSDDSKVQAKIDRLFTEARQLLEKYLDPQEIEAAAAKIDRARRGETAVPPMPTATPAMIPPATQP